MKLSGRILRGTRIASSAVMPLDESNTHFLLDYPTLLQACGLIY
jgi:hypothetical protein